MGGRLPERGCGDAIFVRAVCVSRTVSGCGPEGCCRSTENRSRSGHCLTLLMACFIIAEILRVNREPDHELVFVMNTQLYQSCCRLSSALDPESEPVRDQSSLSVVFIQPIGNFLLSFSVM